MICDDAVCEDSYSLKYVPDWFVMQELVKIWHDDDDYYNDDDLVEWYTGYKQHKAQSAQIKEELMSIAWHPMRIQDWCMIENE